MYVTLKLNLYVHLDDKILHYYTLYIYILLYYIIIRCIITILHYYTLYLRHCVFVGINCEQRYSECSNQPCLNNGTCLDYDGITCQCPDGYSGKKSI